ncbi:MAG: hypothetical protein JXQ23_11720 [Clostridia bacterium]|nr:hypothetical protein [Clostridia bacterium]
MIIDVNTYLGHWPFRKINHNESHSLSAYLKKSQIDQACVSSLNAIFYKDTQQGNLELAEEIKGEGDFFIPFAVINPTYAGWEKDFIYCISTLKMKGLMLYPYYHGYKLTDDCAVSLINLAAKMNVPVHLPCAIENIRQKHPMDTEENLSLSQVSEVLSLCSDADFIISNGSTHAMAKSLKNIIDQRNGEVFFDFARVEVFTEDLDQLIDYAGIDHVVFGSVAPFQYIDPQLVKLNYLKTDDLDKIKYKNLSRLLRIK